MNNTFTIKSIKISDFLCIKNEEIVFPDTGLILLSGWNNDLDRSNGAGKSSVMHAIIWCLFGEIPKKIKIDEIIRRGQPSCNVELFINKNGKDILISRSRPSGLVVKIDNEVIKGNPKVLQNYIIQEIGYSYDQFLLVSYFPQKGDSSRFLNLKDSDAKDFLGKVLSFSQCDAQYKKISLKLNDTVQEESNKNLVLEKYIEKYKEYEMLLSDETSISPPDKERVSQLKERINEIEKELSIPLDTPSIDAEIIKFRTAKQSIANSKLQRSLLEKDIQDLTNKANREKFKKSSPLICPVDGAKLTNINNELILFDEKAFNDNINKNIESLHQEIENKKIEIVNLENKIIHESKVDKRLEKLQEEKFSLMRKPESLKSEKVQRENELSSLVSQENHYNNWEKQRNRMVITLEETGASIETLKEEIKLLEERERFCAALKEVLSAKGAIAYGLDSIISDINTEVSYYLDIFSKNTMSYKLSSGEGSVKVSHEVSYQGDNVSLGSLSGGEEKCLSLSVDLGLSEVISKRNGTPLPSLFMLDESFDGLDYIGKEKVLDALKEIAETRCIIVIDHMTEFSALFDRKLTVTKSNNIATIIFE